MDNLDKWKCKECDEIIYAPKEKRDDIHFCPYCDHACMFNITFEKELGNL